MAQNFFHGIDGYLIIYHGTGDISSKAMEALSVSRGQKTFQDVCAEQGKDWKEAVNEMAEVLEYGRSVGVELGGVIFGNGTTAAQQNTAGK